MTTTPTASAIEAIWRLEATRIIARVARLVEDIEIAEDVTQDALVAALTKWPTAGVPRNPGAWLTSVAKLAAIDLIRRNDRYASKIRLIERQTMTTHDDDFDAVVDDRVPDDVLGLMLMSCHPVLAFDARVALTLRVVAGLTTDQIARALLISEPTVAQRIVRAKRTLAAAHVPFEVPPRAKIAERLDAVLEVIFLVFNEGYSATSGSDWTRPALCEEALRLGRILAHVVSDQSEAHGLVALMEIQISRLAARRDSDGKPVLLADQNRGLWNQIHIRRGLAALAAAEELGVSLGPYALQGAIAACHARATSIDTTDWEQMVGLYEALNSIAPSPVVALNHAVAVSRAYGPGPALELVDELAATGNLNGYHLLPAVRADLLHRLGRTDEAVRDLRHAATLTRNDSERHLLLERAQEFAADG